MRSHFFSFYVGKDYLEDFQIYILLSNIGGTLFCDKGTKYSFLHKNIQTLCGNNYYLSTYTLQEQCIKSDVLLTAISITAAIAFAALNPLRQYENNV